MPASPRAVLLARWWPTFLFSRFRTFFSTIAIAAWIEVSCGREAPLSRGCFVIAEGIFKALQHSSVLMDLTTDFSFQNSVLGMRVDPQYITCSFSSCRKRSLWWNFVAIENSRTFPPNSPHSDRTNKHRRFIFSINLKVTVTLSNCHTVTLSH